MSVQERFYRRNYERYRAEAPAEEMFRDDPSAPGHRYHAAWRAIETKRYANLLELGFGVSCPIERIAACVGRYDIIDIVDLTDGRPLPENCALHLANLDEPFPFPDAAYDAVLAMMVIEHLYDPFAAFAELARVLKPGGDAFINLPNVAALRNRWLLATGRLPMTSSLDWFEKREWDGNHLHYFTVAEVRRLAALYGLETTGAHAVGRFVALKRLWPALLSHEVTFSFVKAA